MKRMSDDVEVYMENVKELISYRYPSVKDILELVESEKGCIKDGNALDGRGVSIALKVCKNIESKIKGQYLKKISKLISLEGNKMTIKPVTCNNLMWSEVAPQQMGWKEAMKYAEDLEEGGYSDWRLPTVSELQQVFDYEKGETKIEFDPANYFWSSTEYYNDQSYAWSVYLHYGYTYYTTKVTAFYVRCVRRE